MGFLYMCHMFFDQVTLLYILDVASLGVMLCYALTYLYL